jgi:hypothetical protein
VVVENKLIVRITLHTAIGRKPAYGFVTRLENKTQCFKTTITVIVGLNYYTRYIGYLDENTKEYMHIDVLNKRKTKFVVEA